MPTPDAMLARLPARDGSGTRVDALGELRLRKPLPFPSSHDSPRVGGKVLRVELRSHVTITRVFRSTCQVVYMASREIPKVCAPRHSDLPRNNLTGAAARFIRVDMRNESSGGDRAPRECKACQGNGEVGVGFRTHEGQDSERCRACDGTGLEYGGELEVAS